MKNGERARLERGQQRSLGGALLRQRIYLLIFTRKEKGIASGWGRKLGKGVWRSCIRRGEGENPEESANQMERAGG